MYHVEEGSGGGTRPRRGGRSAGRGIEDGGDEGGQGAGTRHLIDLTVSQANDGVH